MTLVVVQAITSRCATKPKKANPRQKKYKPVDNGDDHAIKDNRRPSGNRVVTITKLLSSMMIHATATMADPLPQCEKLVLWPAMVILQGYQLAKVIVDI